MMPPIFEAPKKVGQLDASAFRAIRACVGTAKPQVSFYSEKGKVEPHLEPLFALMRPLYDRYVATFGDADFLRYDVDCSDVQGDKPQRELPSRWHVDSYPSVQSCDALPTDCLVNAAKTRLKSGQQKARERWLGTRDSRNSFQMPKDDELSTIGFTIHNPKPFEIVAYIGQIHRSAVNPRPNTLRRTWMRIMSL